MNFERRKNDPRRDPDKMWMDVARAVADRSKCPKQVGAVIVGADGRVQATGYNGPPAGYNRAIGLESSVDFCPRDMPGHVKASDYSDCVCVHAELNALLYSDVSRRQGGTLYVTSVPCFDCAKALSNSGLLTIVFNESDLYARPHRDPRAALDFMVQCGLRLEGMRL